MTSLNYLQLQTRSLDLPRLLLVPLFPLEHMFLRARRPPLIDALTEFLPAIVAIVVFLLRGHIPEWFVDVLRCGTGECVGGGRAGCGRVLVDIGVESDRCRRGVRALVKLC